MAHPKPSGEILFHPDPGETAGLFPTGETKHRARFKKTKAENNNYEDDNEKVCSQLDVGYVPGAGIRTWLVVLLLRSRSQPAFE